MNEKNNLKNIFYQCGYYKIENFFSEEFIKELNLEIENAKNVKKYYDKNNKLRRIEKLYDKLERLKKPKYHENGRKKRTTKANKIAIENTEKKYWTEHYRLFPGDKPRKKGRKPKR